MSLHNFPNESLRLLETSFLYVLSAFALDGVRARLQAPFVVADENSTNVPIGFPAPAAEVTGQANRNETYSVGCEQPRVRITQLTQECCPPASECNASR